MHIPFLSRALALPFVLLIIYYFSYGQFQSDSADGWTLIPSVIILMLLYVFNEQINKWWWTHKAPPLDPRMQSWIEVYSPVYKNLNHEDQKKFRDRISVFMRIKEFTLKSKKDYQLEEDMKVIIAHEFIKISMHQDDFYFPELEHIVVYNHPFATPNKEFIHSYEYNREDKVIILSRESIINGFNSGLDYYNVVLHAAIGVYLHQYPRKAYPDTKDLNIANVARGLKINLESVEATLGDKMQSKLQLFIYAYMEFPERMKSSFPQEHFQLNNIFR